MHLYLQEKINKDHNVKMLKLKYLKVHVIKKKNMLKNNGKITE